MDYATGIDVDKKIEVHWLQMYEHIRAVFRWTPHKLFGRAT